MLPRFLAYFIFGLHLSPLNFVWRKGKGRACINNTSTIGPHDDGTPNASIPDPSTFGQDDECPAVHCATAFKWHITWIWNLHISHPLADILQFGDDVHAAFHRMLYHPDIAIVFAFVFQEFQCIPVGTVFGARNSPSWCWQSFFPVVVHRQLAVQCLQCLLITRPLCHGFVTPLVCIAPDSPHDQAESPTANRKN
jgi:hypothetical protein